MKPAIIASNLESEASTACNLISAIAVLAGFFSLSSLVSNSQVLLELVLRRRRYVERDSSRQSLIKSMLSAYFQQMTSIYFFSSCLSYLTLLTSPYKSFKNRRNTASLTSPISTRMSTTSIIDFCLLGALLPQNMGLLRVALLGGGSQISKLLSSLRMLSINPPQKIAGPLGSSFRLICWSSGDSTDSITSSWKVSFTGVRPKEIEALS